MQMARQTASLLSPHLKPGARVDPRDFMLFPDDALDIPDDLSPEEQRLWLQMKRSEG